MRIEEVQSTTKKQRVATHTHIKGLGLRVSILTQVLYESAVRRCLDVRGPARRGRVRREKEGGCEIPAAHPAALTSSLTESFAPHFVRHPLRCTLNAHSG